MRSRRSIAAVQLPSALAVAVSLACATPTVLAQDNTLESIVVTADRQDRELRNIAASVFRVGSEDLETVRHTHINEALARVPGTWVSRGNGQEHLTAIRSPVLTGAGSCGAFQMSEDGIPLRAAGFCNVNQLFEANTEQAGGVEVIRGPGSVLYGANALHGAINVLSEAISESREGMFSYELGPHVYNRVKFGYSDTQGNHGFRVNFNGTTDDGYKHDSGFDQQKLTLKHQYTNGNFRMTNVLGAVNLNQETAGFIEGPRAYRDRELKRFNPNPESYRDSRSYRMYSRMEWETAAGNVMVTPYYRKTDMAFLQHFLPGTPVEENGHESLGLQTMFASHDNGVFSWMGGVDFEFTQGYLLEDQAGPPVGASPVLTETLPAGRHYDFEVDAQLISPFLQGRWQFDDRNQITAGIRYESLRYDYQNRMIDGRTREDGTPCGFGGCRFNRPADRSDSFDNVSAQLGWIRDLSDVSQVYTNLASAFRAPQTNEMYRLQGEQNVADLKSEEMRAFEMGYRASRDSLSYNLALFYMEKDNVIFQDSDRRNVSNGETRHRGVEMNVAYAFNSSLSMTVAGSYARHQYVADIDERGFSIDLNGNDIDTAPKLTGSAQLRWRISEQRRLELEWVHMGPYFTDELNQARYGGHDLVNLRYQVDRGAWFYGARITNLLNTHYAERADFGFGNERYFVGEPISLYMTVGARF